MATSGNEIDPALHVARPLTEATLAHIGEVVQEFTDGSVEFVPNANPGLSYVPVEELRLAFPDIDVTEPCAASRYINGRLQDIGSQSKYALATMLGPCDVRIDEMNLWRKSASHRLRI